MTLEVSHIAKSFGENFLLKDVSFSLNKGTRAILMGANGCGKSTLFNIITGFIKPDKGQVFLDGVKVEGKRPFEINRSGIIRTFQDMRLIGNLSVLENVLLAFSKQEREKWWKALIQNKKPKSQEENDLKKAYDYLKTCFIDDVAENKASEISYGQQKLLNLACCMANGADVWLLDEPVAGVNIEYRSLLSEVVKKVSKDKAVLIIEHTTDFIEAIADKILFLNEGKLKEFQSFKIFQKDIGVQNAYV